MDNESMATELLHELKSQVKMWFILFIIILLLWFSTIGSFIWYISLPIEEYTIEQDSQDNGNNQIIGGDYNGKANCD